MLCPGVQATQQRYDMSITTTPHGRGQPTRFDSILGAEEVIEDLILNLGAAAATKAFILMLKTGFLRAPALLAMRHWSRPHRTTLVELSVLHVGNLYSSYETHWNEFDAWQQPTGLMGPVGLGLGVYVDNLKVLWGLLDRVWGCMLATYRSHGACWTEFGAISQQPTGLMGPFLYCTLATYRPQGAYWAKFDAAWRQPTCLVGHVGLSLGLYVGNLLVLWGLLGRVWAVCWPCLTRPFGPSLGMYVGNLQVLSGLSSLVLYVGNLLVLQVWLYLGNLHSSQEACWSEFGA